MPSLWPSPMLRRAARLQRPVAKHRAMSTESTVKRVLNALGIEVRYLLPLPLVFAALVGLAWFDAKKELAKETPSKPLPGGRVMLKDGSIVTPKK